jgi:hypothetical protein
LSSRSGPGSMTSLSNQTNLVVIIATLEDQVQFRKPIRSLKDLPVARFPAASSI